MARKQDALRAAKLTAMLCAGLALAGCGVFRHAVGIAKMAPGPAGAAAVPRPRKPAVKPANLVELKAIRSRSTS